MNIGTVVGYTICRFDAATADGCRGGSQLAKRWAPGAKDDKNVQQQVFVSGHPHNH